MHLRILHKVRPKSKGFTRTVFTGHRQVFEYFAKLFFPTKFREFVIIVDCKFHTAVPFEGGDKRPEEQTAQGKHVHAKHDKKNYR